MKRFSRSVLREWIERAQSNAEYEAKRTFDPNNGYAQVLNAPENVQRAYGAYAALRDLMDEFNLR